MSFVSSRRKWAIGLGVLAVGLVLQLLPLLMTERREGAMPRMVFWLIEMPSLVFCLSASYEWAHQRRLRTGLTVLLGLTLALGIGALASVLAWSLVARVWGPDALPGPSGRPLGLATLAAFGAISGLFHCGLWAFAFVYPFAVEDSRLQSAEADKLRLEAEGLRTQSELSRLRSQLEPHFLLNTLNAIAGLVTQEPKEARRLLALLGDLLSDTLKDEEEPQTLGREMTWLRGYTSILESRFGSALRVEWEVDELARDVFIPHLLLQPLLENAVTHGALKRGSGGAVNVRASLGVDGRGQNQLVCVIEDNGPGFDTQGTRAGAIGLRAVRRRLELWSPEARLTLESSPLGSRATVELPERKVA